MNKLTCALFVWILMLLGPACFAQQTPEMADTMRSNGKIYVVVTVCLIILFGLLMYVVTLDRKIGKLEKNMNSNH